MALIVANRHFVRTAARVGLGSNIQARGFAATLPWLHDGGSTCCQQHKPNRGVVSPSLNQKPSRHISSSRILRATSSPVGILDPTNYAIEAVQLAKQGLEQPTFGVGGVLLDKDGTIINAMHNNVIENSCINDPTAHGERQLISWYFENQNNLPPAHELTIVTSLDPCLMCTGSFLTSGINVAVVSHDTMAGIDWKNDQQFTGIPQNIRDLAVEQFSYLGVSDGSSARPFAGSANSVFYNGSVAGAVDQTSSSIFGESAGIVHEILDHEDPTPVNIKDKPDAPELQLLQQYWSLAATKVADITTALGRELLYGAMAAVAFTNSIHGRERNSAALIDPFNNVLLIMPCGPTPLDTPFMMLTRAYSACRRAANHAQDGTLPHPKRCKFVLFNGPGAETTDVMDLGAFGSTLEGPSLVKDNLLYFNPKQSESDLKNMIANFPPLYSETIGISPKYLPRPF